MFSEKFDIVFVLAIITISICSLFLGIFGNSIDTHEPSWQIMTEAINNFIQAGVSSEENPGLRDYPYIKV